MFGQVFQLGFLALFFQAQAFAIIGGTLVPPWDPVAASTVLIKTDFDSVCAGTLISEHLIVSAAHCFEMKPNDLRIYFGSGSEKKILHTKKYLLNPDFDSQKDVNRNDISVVYIDEKIPNGAFAAEIASDGSFLRNGMSVIIAGFGRLVDTDHSDASQKRELYQAEVPVARNDFSDFEFLTDESHGKATCYGDSGGPVYGVNGAKRIVVGITSRSFDLTEDCGGYGIYTKVSPYKTWLRESEKELRSW